jgi:hypothetical protein
MKRADLFVGLLILFLSAMMFVLTQRFVGQAYTGYGPDRFPRFLALVWGVLGLCLIVNALRGKFIEEEMRITAFGLKRVGMVLAITVAVLISMKWLGFLLASVVYIFVIMSYLGERSWLGRSAASVGISLGVYLIFRYVMVVPLPECCFLSFI